MFVLHHVRLSPTWRAPRSRHAALQASYSLNCFRGDLLEDYIGDYDIIRDYEGGVSGVQTMGHMSIIGPYRIIVKGPIGCLR